jgi:hypothetical protein
VTSSILRRRFLIKNDDADADADATDADADDATNSIRRRCLEFLFLLILFDIIFCFVFKKPCSLEQQ